MGELKVAPFFDVLRVLRSPPCCERHTNKGARSYTRGRFSFAHVRQPTAHDTQIVEVGSVVAKYEIPVGYPEPGTEIGYASSL